MASEFNYVFYSRPAPGTYHFDVSVVSNSCSSGVCCILRSLDTVIGKYKS
jgi:hypothetical protein